MAYSASERATAVARVLAGESRRKVAGEMGVSPRTVRRWLDEAERADTPRAQTLAERAQAIADEIEHWETIARHRLIERIACLAVDSEDLAAATNAYSKLSEKALLRAGKPTGIHEHRASDPLDAEIEQLLSEEAAKRDGDTADADIG